MAASPHLRLVSGPLHGRSRAPLHRDHAAAPGLPVHYPLQGPGLFESFNLPTRLKMSPEVQHLRLRRPLDLRASQRGSPRSVAGRDTACTRSPAIQGASPPLCMRSSTRRCLGIRLERGVFGASGVARRSSPAASKGGSGRPREQACEGTTCYCLKLPSA